MFHVIFVFYSTECLPLTYTPCVFLCPEWEGMWLTSSQYVKGKGNLQMCVRLQSVDFYLSKVIYTDLPSVGLDSLGKKPLNAGLRPSWDERLSSRAWWSKQLCWRSPCGEDVWSASTIWGQLPANSQQKAGSSMIRFSPSHYSTWEVSLTGTCIASLGSEQSTQMSHVEIPDPLQLPAHTCVVWRWKIRGNSCKLILGLLYEHFYNPNTSNP